MDVTVTARHTTVSDRFRSHLAEKVEKVQQLCPKCIRVDAVVSEEHNPRLQSTAFRIELTVHSKGPVVRGEADAGDPYGALDLAFAKLAERLRRTRDRRKVHHGRHTPESLRFAGDRWEGSADEQSDAVDSRAELAADAEGSPVTIREKEHSSAPMTMDQALYEMELVGHDFFLFVDSANGRPSVVYRRKGWSYGVIRLDGVPAASGVQGLDGRAVLNGGPGHTGEDVPVHAFAGNGPGSA